MMSKAVNVFHSILGAYIGMGWTLSEYHQENLLFLIPLMYGNWLVDDNNCIFTRLERYFERDTGNTKGFVSTKLNELGINIDDKSVHKLLVFVSGHSFIQCYRDVILH